MQQPKGRRAVGGQVGFPHGGRDKKIERRLRAQEREKEKETAMIAVSELSPLDGVTSKKILAKMKALGSPTVTVQHKSK